MKCRIYYIKQLFWLIILHSCILRGTAAKQNSDFQSLSLLCLPFCQIFLQAQPFFIHLCGGLNANIPIMPYFLGNARDVGFISRVTEDKTVFVAVFLQPEIKIIGGSVDVQRQNMEQSTGPDMTMGGLT